MGIIIYKGKSIKWLCEQDETFKEFMEYFRGLKKRLSDNSSIIKMEEVFLERYSRKNEKLFSNPPYFY